MSTPPTLPHSLHTLIDFVAGSLGAVASVYVGQPLDTVKVKLQTFPELYKNSLQCAIATYKNDGIARGLFAGTAPALVANIAENSVLFAAYGLCQKTLYHLLDKTAQSPTTAIKSAIDDIIPQGETVNRPADHLTLSPLENATAGAMAAIFSTFVLCPTELIKCRVQALRETSAATSSCKPNTGVTKHDTTDSKNARSPKMADPKPVTRPPNIGPWYVTKQIYKTEGFMGFFRGLAPTFAREVPGYFCFFGGYELTRSLLTPPGKSKDDLGPLQVILSGGVGGTALWLSIFPFDVVKSRMQVFPSGASFVTVFMDILRNQGIKGLYNGLGPTLLRTFPASGALFLTYEYTKCHMITLAQAHG